MEVTGIQAVGARGFTAVQATVTESSQSDRQASAGPAAERDSTPAIPRSALPEAVVFPRDGTPIDRRPVQLRHARATARYRRDGGGRNNRREEKA